MLDANEVIDKLEMQMGRKLTDFERTFIESFKVCMDGMWSKQNGQAEGSKGDADNGNDAVFQD